MSGIGHANNSSLYLGDYNSYLRTGVYLFDPSGKNASYMYKSLNRKEMKHHLIKNFTKEDIVDMLLDFVEISDNYQEITA